jgi:hypothetical protein
MKKKYLAFINILNLNKFLVFLLFSKKIIWIITIRIKFMKIKFMNIIF